MPYNNSAYSAVIQRRYLSTVNCQPLVAHTHNARIPKSFTYVSHSFGEINLPSSQPTLLSRRQGVRCMELCLKAQRAALV